MFWVLCSFTSRFCVTYSSTSVLSASAANFGSVDVKSTSTRRLPCTGATLDPAEERRDQRRFVGALVGLGRLDRLGRRRGAHQVQRALLEVVHHRERRHRRRRRAVELGHRLEVQLLDHRARQVAPLDDPVLRLVVEIRVFVVRVVLLVDPRHHRRSLVFDEQPRLRLVELDVRVALDHHRDRREREDRDRDAAVAIEDREAIQDVDVGVGRVGSAAAPEDRRPSPATWRDAGCYTWARPSDVTGPG